MDHTVWGNDIDRHNIRLIDFHAVLRVNRGFVAIQRIVKEYTCHIN